MKYNINVIRMLVKYSFSDFYLGNYDLITNPQLIPIQDSSLVK